MSLLKVCSGATLESVGTRKRCAGRRYNRAKKAHGGDRKSEESRDQFEPLKTAEKLATEHGVSPATVKRAGQYAEAVAVVEKTVPGFSQAIAAPRQAVIKAAATSNCTPRRWKACRRCTDLRIAGVPCQREMGALLGNMPPALAKCPHICPLLCRDDLRQYAPMRGYSMLIFKEEKENPVHPETLPG